MKQLSDTQRRILVAASKDPKTDIATHMDFLKSPAVRRQVTYSMLCSGYITDDGDQHFISDEGVAVIGGKAAKATSPKPEKQKKSTSTKTPKPKKATADRRAYEYSLEARSRL